MASSKPDLARLAQSLDEQNFLALIKAHEVFVAGRPGGSRALARYVSAHNMRCDRRILADIDLTGSDLTCSTFIGSDMRRATLFRATLEGCNFTAASLMRADLRGAQFSGANLTSANLDDADMRAAILCEDHRMRDPTGQTRLAGSSLRRVNLDDAVAHSVDFTNCELKGASLRRANLKNADFSGASLEAVDFGGARLEGVNFKDAILIDVDITRLGLPSSALAQCVVGPSPDALARVGEIEAQLDGVDLWVRTNGAQGAPADLTGFDLRPGAALFCGRVLAALRAENARAIGVDFSKCHLVGANFDGADLRKASFRGADLRGASFRNARLSHADFRGADIASLKLARGFEKRCSFDGASLEGTGLVALDQDDIGSSPQTTHWIN